LALSEIYVKSLGDLGFHLKSQFCALLVLELQQSDNLQQTRKNIASELLSLR
jgi:hypothetical protein